MSRITLESAQTDLLSYWEQAQLDFRLFRDFQNQHNEYFLQEKLTSYDILFDKYKAVILKIINGDLDEPLYKEFRRAHVAIVQDFFFTCIPELLMPEEIAESYEMMRHEAQRPFGVINNALAFIYKHSQPRQLPSV